MRDQTSLARVTPGRLAFVERDQSALPCPIPTIGAVPIHSIRARPDSAARTPGISQSPEEQPCARD